MTGTAIATATRLLWRMLELRNIDPAPLFIESGLDPERLNDPQARYAWKEARLAWRLASDLVADPAFGLSITEVWRPSDFHGLGCAFLASSTLRDALTRLIRYNAVVYDVISYSLAERGNRIVFSYTAQNQAFDEPAILEDARWAVILDACRRIYGNDLVPDEVCFCHSRPDTAMDEFRAYFRCPLSFGEPVAGMTFPAEILDEPLAAANRELALTLDQSLQDYISRLQKEDMVSRTRSAISACLSSGDATIQKVADSLHMSPRNLQRKLSGEGSTYRALFDTARLELARSYLKDDEYSMAEISYLLGFSSQAAFSRAFKRWTGSNPQDYRINT